MTTVNLTAKAETKKAVLHSLGCDADDWLEGAKKNVAGFGGAKQALAQAVKNVQALADAVTQDMDDGKLAGLNALEVAAYAKLQITKAVDSLSVQVVHMSNLQLSATGEVSAYEKLVSHYTKLRDQEEQKIVQVREALASGAIVMEDDGSISQADASGGRRVPGARPQPGIAAQRRAEADKEESAKDEPKAKPKKAKKKAKKTFKCGNCGTVGHTARGCPDKKSAKGG